MSLGLQSSLHHSGLPSKIAYAFLIYLMQANVLPIYAPSLYGPNNIWQWLQIVKLFITLFSPLL
jgi:hypothetical protein